MDVSFQRAAGHVFHHDVIRFVAKNGFVSGNNIRMDKFACQCRLVLQLLAAEPRQRLVDQLHRGIAVVREQVRILLGALAIGGDERLIGGPVSGGWARLDFRQAGWLDPANRAESLGVWKNANGNNNLWRNLPPATCACFGSSPRPWSGPC